MKTFGNFLLNLLKENPVFGLYLGICSTLAITTNLDNAIGMGVSVTIVLTISNILISSIRKITPNEIRIPVYIIVIATLTKAIELLIKAFAPTIDAALGVYLPLIVVNCIILGRAEAYASKNGIGKSTLDGLNMGLAYTLSLAAMSLIRQILADGIVSLNNPFTQSLIFKIDIIPAEYRIAIFKEPIGAFLTFAFLAAGVAAIQNAHNKKVEVK
jgi:Na+-translocating ferredoxin:NAD+ oxidoreductase subunit E